MKRRNFLQLGALGTLPLLLNGLPLSAIARPAPFRFANDDSDRVLVLVQLVGGNDGLNTIVPLDQYDQLAIVRPSVILPKSSLLKINDLTALHPSMGGIKNIFEQGKLGIVQSVGYPDQNRSHFRSTDIWTSGSAANENLSTGWLGRYLDSHYPTYPEGYPNAQQPDPFAINIGYTVSETCQGAASNFSLAVTDPFALGSLPVGAEGPTDSSPYGTELAFLQEAVQQTNAYTETILAAANNANNLSNLYDATNSLAKQLAVVARLVAGGLRTKIYVVSLGGFDTHANQVAQSGASEGIHASLLRTLSEAMAAFQDDLKLLGVEERVLSMTFSEFGRLIRSNSSLGTDHGSAAPLLLFGACVRPIVTGNSPSIDTAIDPNEGVPMQHDFRSIYGSILMDWFGASEAEVKSILYDDFQYINLLGCGGSTPTQTVENLLTNVTAFPNPFSERTRLRLNLATGCPVRVEVLNTLGHRIQLLANKNLQPGTHELDFEAKGLPSGNYFFKVQTPYGIHNTKIIKI